MSRQRLGSRLIVYSAEACCRDLHIDRSESAMGDRAANCAGKSETAVEREACGLVLCCLRSLLCCVCYGGHYGVWCVGSVSGDRLAVLLGGQKE